MARKQSRYHFCGSRSGGRRVCHRAEPDPQQEKGQILLRLQLRPLRIGRDLPQKYAITAKHPAGFLPGVTSYVWRGF